MREFLENLKYTHKNKISEYKYAKQHKNNPNIKFDKKRNLISEIRNGQERYTKSVSPPRANGPVILKG